MGAWIETVVSSLTLRLPCFVAPFVGAWIETFGFSSNFSLDKSHPLWVRGLKPFETYNLAAETESHPLWVRGLKLGFV